MFSNLSRWRVFVLLVLTCLLFVTLDRRGNAVIERARSGFDTVLHPFDTAVDAIAKPIANVWYSISNYDDLQDENARLRDQLDAQRGAEVEARAAILEYYELLKVNRLTAAGNFPRVAGRVINLAPSNFQNTVQINKGSNDGIRVGMPVVDSSGLIGRITQVSANSSLVLLLTDPQFSVRAEVLQSDIDLPISPPPTGSTTPSGLPADTTSTTTTTPPVTTTTQGVINEGATPTLAPGDTSGGTVPGTSPDTTTSSTLPDVTVVRETGNLQGQGAGKPMLLTLVDDRDLKVGAVVKTAGGTDDLFPQGLPIGVISRVETVSGNRSPVVEVTPNTRLSQLIFIAVVLYLPNQKA